VGIWQRYCLVKVRTLQEDRERIERHVGYWPKGSVVGAQVDLALAVCNVKLSLWCALGNIAENDKIEEDT
jgi:hypothetical protein